MRVTLPQSVRPKTSRPKTPLLKIGEVADLSGLAIKTVRYYEDLGLIAAQQRTSANYRLFEPGVLSRLSFIRRVQRLGFSLEQIRHILEIRDQGHLPCEDVRQQIEAKLLDIDHQIQQLLTLKHDLQHLIEQDPAQDRWQEAQDPSPDLICPILQSAEAMPTQTGWISGEQDWQL